MFGKGLNRLILLCLSTVAAPSLAQPATREHEKDKSLRVMTFNIRFDNPADGENGWRHRRDGVAKLIEEQKVHVAGLQEVMANQLDDLRERLPEYEFLGVGRDDGKRKGEFSPLLVRRSALTVIASGTFWLSPNPEKVGSIGWDAVLPRVCTWAHLRSARSDECDLLAASTHFDHRGAKARLESAKLIQQQLKKIYAAEKVTGGVIVLGDFNCKEGDDPYRMLMEKKDAKATWIDAYHAEDVVREGPDSTWNGFDAVVPGQRIDFVFCRGFRPRRHEVIAARIGDRFLSDHLPVLVTLD